MDLRPKLAKEFATAAYRVFEAAPTADMPDEVIAKATAAILDLFVSHSLPLPSGGTACEYDQPTCLAFVAKYPRIQELIDLAKAEALRRWPEATFQLKLHSDPECGHITHEGQSLTLNIQAGLEFYGEDGEMEGSPYDQAEDAWMEWTWGWDDDANDGEGGRTGPYATLEAEVGDVAHLFSVDLQWAPEADESEE